jgi:hypothetical protein
MTLCSVRATFGGVGSIHVYSPLAFVGRGNASIYNFSAVRILTCASSFQNRAMSNTTMSRMQAVFPRLPTELVHHTFELLAVMHPKMATT